MKWKTGERTQSLEIKWPICMHKRTMRGVFSMHSQVGVDMPGWFPEWPTQAAVSWTERGGASRQMPWSGQICPQDHPELLWHPPGKTNKRKIRYRKNIPWFDVDFLQYAAEVKEEKHSCLQLMKCREKSRKEADKDTQKLNFSFFKLRHKELATNKWLPDDSSNVKSNLNHTKKHCGSEWVICKIKKQVSLWTACF